MQTFWYTIILISVKKASKLGHLSHF